MFETGGGKFLERGGGGPTRGIKKVWEQGKRREGAIGKSAHTTPKETKNPHIPTPKNQQPPKKKRYMQKLPAYKTERKRIRAKPSLGKKTETA